MNRYRKLFKNKFQKSHFNTDLFKHPINGLPNYNRCVVILGSILFDNLYYVDGNYTLEGEHITVTLSKNELRAKPKLPEAPKPKL